MMIRSALAVFLAASCTFAAPPTDEQIESLVKTVSENRTKMMEAQTKMREAMQPKEGEAKPDTKAIQAEIKELNESNKAAAEKVDLSEATLPQIEKLVTGQVTNIAEVRKALAAPLTELSKAKTVEGARATELRVQTYPAAASNKPEDQDARSAELAKVCAEGLKHPSLAALMKDGKGDYLIRQTGMFKPETIKENGLIAALEPVLAYDMSVTAAGALGGIVDKVGTVVDTGDKDRVLDKIAAAADKAAASAPETTPAASVKRAKDTAKLARSAWARGTLIGGDAPEITFHWTNANYKKLSDLKGKVVVLDFWATWCGPCIASFPKIRDLQARYADYPVVIVGVTSLQGYHIDHPNGRTKIDCKDDAQKELGLMPGFIKGMDMTWGVAFSEDGCFNPNYGVRGIPHLAIIDPAGKVRFNNLHPANPVDGKIDDLLKEFKLKAPAEPMAKKGDKEAAGS